MRSLIDIGQLSQNYYRFEAHTHKCWEVCYYISGSGVNNVGGMNIPFKKSVIICQPPGIYHEETSEEGYRNIYFSLEHMYNFNMRIPFFLDGVNYECLQIIEQMLHIFYSRPHNWQNMIDAALSLLAEYFVSYKKHKKNPEVEAFEKLMIDNMDNPDFSVADHIEKIPFSNTYFMKLFKKETGFTPTEYLTEMRIGHARRVMATGSIHRVKDIAVFCGFKDPYYFSRVFKKITGVSPENFITLSNDE